MVGTAMVGVLSSSELMRARRLTFFGVVEEEEEEEEAEAALDGLRMMPVSSRAEEEVEGYDEPSTL